MKGSGSRQILEVSKVYKFPEGNIFGSVIPLGLLPSVLQLDTAEFKEQYKIDLPGLENKILMSLCRLAEI